MVLVVSGSPVPDVVTDVESLTLVVDRALLLSEQLTVSATNAIAANPYVVDVPFMPQMLSDAYEQCVKADGTESEARKFLWS